MFNPIIDSQKEHNQVLFELGLLDDEENWSLFQVQEERFNEVMYNLDDSIIEKYMLVNGRKLIIRKV